MSLQKQLWIDGMRPTYQARFGLGHFPALALLVAFSYVAVGVNAQEPEIDFGRQIQPILAKRCYQCHGPDKAEGGLRLDQKEKAFGLLESGEKAIIPSQADKSELLRRITSTDHTTQMPPEGARLSTGQIELLTRWIAAGANWTDHWAFQPMQNPVPPAVQNGGWIANPIDAFILHKLEQKGLAPAAPADKTQLLRRITYDLTGLPPNWQDVQNFLADQSPEAYEKVVDRLLNSPHYGERWGRHWLDVVRYADTNSFERDGNKPFAWRYRDYVIRAFNEDKPYNQFVSEQIAGDEIPGASRDQIIATGYYRLGLWDDEPADRMQAKYDVLDDVVATTGQVFLGLTVNCARCHDHKIDPIPQTDYYGMLAFFHGMTLRPDTTQQIFDSPQQEADYHRQVKELEDQRNQTQTELTQIEADFLKLAVGETTAAVGDKPDGAQPAVSQVGNDLDELTYAFYRDSWDKLPDFDNLKAESDGKLSEGLFDIRPATRQDNFGFVYKGFLKIPQDGKYTFLLDSDDGSRLWIDGKQLLELDGIHGTGKPQLAAIDLKAGRVPVRLDYFQAHSGKGLEVAWMGPNFRQRSLSFEGAKNLNLKDFLKAGGESLLGKERYDAYLALQKKMTELKDKKIPVDMAMCVTEEGPKGPDTFLLKRGSPRVLGDKVEPCFPTITASAKPVIPEPAAGAKSSGRRLVLANWMTQPNNSLTARVMVNRVWQNHFGRGIARSPNNFGQLGDRPTHPDLLDWLAQHFAQGGWKVKELHKLMVMSNTYRMSSAMNAQAYKVDPLNDLFWRFDMRRLSAEEVRDSLYVVTGQFNPTMYGPGIYPEISAEVLAGQSNPGQGWGKSSPEEQARRSVYIHVKRSLITPILADFDFADTDTSCAARFATTQPTQALGMLNGKFLNDQAKALGARLQKEAGPEATEQAKLAVRLLASREASVAEIERAVTLRNMLKTKHNLSEEAALQTYCLMLLSLNEFVYLD